MEYSVLSGQSPPSTSSVFPKRNKFFLPLSNHGMPRTPLPSSPGTSIRSHRFGSLRSPRSPRADSLNSPLLSPPLSARSANTFIESEPSTPTYSPRAPSSNWDGSTLVFLSPQPTPAFPNEPEWEMLTTSRKNSDTPKPLPKQTTKDLPLRDRAWSLDTPPERIARSTSLSSHPPTPHAAPEQKLQRSSEKREEKETNTKEIGKENIPPEDNSTPLDTAGLDEQTAATLGKLASRMKHMLRRKTFTEKKPEGGRRRGREDVDRMVSVHWSEM